MERVRLVPHDPAWSTLFDRESIKIQHAIGNLSCTIHHIGSTSIPDIAAKPIIDMLLVVDDVQELDARTHAMTLCGYEAMGEFGIPGRRYFRKYDAGGERTHHVHAFSAASPEIERHLVFRDFLRVHRQYAEAYEAVKVHLATLHPHDREAYTDGKTEFITDVEAKAARWRVEPATKACAVVVRQRDAGPEVLVFRHPTHGVQFVKGTIEQGESAAQAAIRELAEETGIERGRVVRSLGTWYSDVNAHLWEFIEVAVEQDLSDTWAHTTHDDNGHTFHMQWHPLHAPATSDWHRPYRWALHFIQRAL